MLCSNDNIKTSISAKMIIYFQEIQRLYSLAAMSELSSIRCKIFLLKLWLSLSLSLPLSLSLSLFATLKCDSEIFHEVKDFYMSKSIYNAFF